VPLRGESIGTAYVRVLADATGLPESVREGFDDADGSFDDAGSASAKRYKKAFTEEVENFDHDEFGRRLDDAFNKALINDEQVQRVVNGPAFKKLERNLVARFGTMGQREADSMRERFLRSGSIEGLANDVENIVARINRNVDKAVRAESAAANKAREDMLKFERDFKRSMDEAEQVSRRVSRDNVNNLEALRRTLEGMQRPVTEVARALFNMRTESKKTGSQVDKDRHVFIRMSQTIDHMADGIGSAFGKGSRSELLNFFGSFIANGVRVIGILPRILGNLGEFTSGFKAAREAGETAFASLKAGFTTMAKDAEGSSTALSEMVSSGLISLPLLVVAIGGIISVLGIVSALVSGIIAAIIALASTISFALVGAIAALTPVVVALGGALGVAILAFKTMDKQTSVALLHAIRPFKNELKSLGDTAREGFMQTFDADLKDVAGSLRQLNPLVEAFGEGLGTIADQIASGLESPTFRRFTNQFTKFIPDALETIGHIGGNLTRTMLAIFTDSIPLAREFLGWLDDITGEFQNFITSNPKKVQDFLRDAADSAKAIGNFLGAAFRVLGDLLFSTSGKQAGDNIFQSMADNLNTFDRFLDKHPDALGEFFKNGENVAKDIGDVAVAIGDIAAALDDPTTRANLKVILDTVAALGKIAPALEAISGFAGFSGLVEAFNKVKTPIIDVWGILQSIGDFLSKDRSFHINMPDFGRLFSGLRGAVGGLFGNSPDNAFQINPTGLVKWIPNVLDRFRGFRTGVRGIFDSLPDVIQRPLRALPGFASGIANRMFNQFSQLPGRLQQIGGWAAAASSWGRSLFNNINNVPDRIRSIFASLPGRLQSIGGWGVAASNWAAEILSRISDVPQQIVDMFAGLGARIAAAIGTVVVHVVTDAPDPIKALVGPLATFGHHAAGGVFDKATIGVFGEAGKEALVPLDRPLSEVDPSVRMLSAIAQGLSTVGVTPMPNNRGRTVNAEFTIITPTEDPAAVAHEVVNQLVATGY